MLKKVPYKSLNAKQQENYNFQKVSAVLADYGYCTLRLSDDWNGADFIAVHVGNENSLNVQLKGRLTFDKKYLNHNIWVCFPYKNEWYLYPHDQLLEKLKAKMNFHNTPSWDKGLFSWNTLSKDLLNSLSEYKL
jgi:hypothetical protein